VYADITLETVSLDTPDNAAVYDTDAPAKRAPTICPLSESGEFPIFLFLHTDCHTSVTNELTRALQSVNKRKKNIQ
jgi:hypothetical protein